MGFWTRDWRGDTYLHMGIARASVMFRGQHGRSRVEAHAVLVAGGDKPSVHLSRWWSPDYQGNPDHWTVRDLDAWIAQLQELRDLIGLEPPVGA